MGRAALRQLLSSQSGHTVSGGEISKQIETNTIWKSNKYFFSIFKPERRCVRTDTQSYHTACRGERGKNSDKYNLQF